MILSRMFGNCIKLLIAYCHLASLLKLVRFIFCSYYFGVADDNKKNNSIRVKQIYSELFRKKTYIAWTSFSILGRGIPNIFPQMLWNPLSCMLLSLFGQKDWARCQPICSVWSQKLQPLLPRRLFACQYSFKFFSICDLFENADVCGIVVGKQMLIFMTFEFKELLNYWITGSERIRQFITQSSHTDLSHFWGFRIGLRGTWCGEPRPQ